VVSSKNYSGINPLLLQAASHSHGFKSKWWATFRQWHNLGGQVMRRPPGVPEGRWGTQIVYCSPIVKTEIGQDGEEVERRFVLLKTYTVFCVDQVQGKHLDHLRVGNAPLSTDQIDERYQHAEAVIAATGADIRHGGDRAFYDFSGDFIQMPHRRQFERAEAYLETCCHELIHWTEPPHRLNWDRATEGYAMGELIAEVGGCMLATELALPTAENLQEHCSYLQHWLQAMKGDPGYIFKASAQASRAVDFILSFSQQQGAVPETEEASVA
jgi:antirestriction protein ArdC